MEDNTETVNHTITLIIVAFNEKENLLPTYETVMKALKGRFADYQDIIFNDGSTDNTGKVADKLAAKDSRVEVIHYDKPKNLGYLYRT